MSIWVIDFIPPDEDWQKMAEIYWACQRAKVTLPDEVERFFDDGPPDPNGQEVHVPHKDWSAEMRNGVEIEVAKIPSKVKVIRFYNCY